MHHAEFRSPISWDEWVPEARVKKWNEANLKFSKELKMEAIVTQKRIADEQKRSNGGGKDEHAAADGPPASTSRGQKRGREADPEKVSS